MRCDFFYTSYIKSVKHFFKKEKEMIPWLIQIQMEQNIHLIHMRVFFLSDKCLTRSKRPVVTFQYGEKINSQF